MAQQGGLRGRPPGGGAQDPGHLRHGAGRVLPLQRRRQLQHLRIGTGGQPARCGHQRLEPAGPVAADPAVQRLPRDAAPGCRTGRYGFGRRSRAPASPLLGRQPLIQGRADQLIAEQPDRLRPLAALVLVQRHLQVLLSNRRPARNRCRAGALARITDHAAARQGRLVLRSLSRVVTEAIPVPAADHHWPRPPPAPASPRPATRPHRSGSGSPRSRSPPRPTRPATHNPIPSGILTSTPAATATPQRTRPEPPPAATPARRSQPRTVAAGTPRLRRSGDAQLPRHGRSTTAQIRSAAYALRNSTVTGNNTWVTAQARQRARRGRSGSLSPSICRARAYPQPPSTPTPARRAGDRHRPPAGTRRGQDQPLPSPSVPPSTTARHPASRPRLQRGAAHPSVPRHTDGAHEQDQPRHHTDRHIGSLNEEWAPRGRHPERRSTHGSPRRARRRWWTPRIRAWPARRFWWGRGRRPGASSQ